MAHACLWLVPGLRKLCPSSAQGPLLRRLARWLREGRRIDGLGPLPELRRRDSAVAPEHGAEILAGAEPDREANLGYRELGPPELFLRLLDAHPLQVIVRRQAGLRFEHVEHARAAEAYMADQVGHAHRLVQVLAEVGDGGGHELLGYGRRHQ